MPRRASSSATSGARRRDTFQGSDLEPDGSPRPNGSFELRRVSRVTQHAHDFHRKVETQISGKLSS
ncbi:hypothetical protein F0U60_33085 [Archangium minus]|uniref:Uncharacterized protein n=1 Tax=Archangium minus TaxID=83450 RepID=A0ABY9WZ60_9BACT|nr:hypothetical protein F0U60_33085 [Archangium minus]